MQLPSTSGYTGNENGLKIIDKTFSQKFSAILLNGAFEKYIHKVKEHFFALH